MKTKQIYIIRHAKAEEHSFAKPDYPRRLIAKGKNKAHRIANELAQDLYEMENTRMISSTADRAYETAEIFAEVLGIEKQNIQLEKSIYEASTDTLLKIVNKAPGKIDNLVLVGHNPGLSHLCSYICETYINLKTSEVAIIELPVGFNFAMVSSGIGILKRIIH